LQKVRFRVSGFCPILSSLPHPLNNLFHLVFVGVQVTLCRFQIGMTQQPLQVFHVAAGLEITGGKGMAKL
jgi:hypothetical protein